MGTKEELVRQRLATEKQAQQEAKVQNAETAAEAGRVWKRELENKLERMKGEAARIWLILEEVDWSGARLYPLEPSVRRHWWSRRAQVEVACLRFASTEGLITFWMTSDGRLLICNDNVNLWSPEQFFVGSAENVDYLMEKVLKALAGFTSVEDFIC